MSGAYQVIWNQQNSNVSGVTHVSNFLDIKNSCQEDYFLNLNKLKQKLNNRNKYYPNEKVFNDLNFM